VAGAYELVLGWFTDLLEGSRLIGGKLERITIADTTVETDPFEMGNLWLDDGQVFERRCFDPDTLHPIK
jgi:hypothetical protein